MPFRLAISIPSDRRLRIYDVALLVEVGIVACDTVGDALDVQRLTHLLRRGVALIPLRTDTVVLSNSPGICCGVRGIVAVEINIRADIVSTVVVIRAQTRRAVFVVRISGMDIQREPSLLMLNRKTSTQTVCLVVHPRVVVDDLRVLRIVTGPLKIRAVVIGVHTDVLSVLRLHVLLPGGRIGIRILDVNMDRLLGIEVDRCTERDDRRVLLIRLDGPREIEEIDAEVDNLGIGLVDIGVQVEHELVILVREEEVPAVIEDVVLDLGSDLSVTRARDVEPVRVLESIRLVHAHAEPTGKIRLKLVVLLDIPLQEGIKAARSELVDSTVVHVDLRGRVWTKLDVVKPTESIDA